jgi:3-oxoacyl-[acyl-carrier-protein] synthase-3
MCTSEVAFRAAQACLKKAGVSAKSLDMIVVATMTPDHPTPATACNLQLKLGATCPAFDLNAACSGFMYALAVGMQFVAAESSRKVLVIGVDLMSRTVNPKDHKTFALFGDGAGAVLLGEGTPEQGLLSYFLGAQADGGQFLCQPAGGTCEPLTPERLEQGRQFVEMDGRAVFKWAVRIIEMASRRVLQDAGLTTDDIDSVVLHQANVRIIDAAVNSLKISRDRVFVNVDRYGNTSAGSIPLALDEAVQAGKIRPGDKVLLVGFGAGLTWGACVAQW